MFKEKWGLNQRVTISRCQFRKASVEPITAAKTRDGNSGKCNDEMMVRCKGQMKRGSEEMWIFIVLGDLEADVGALLKHIFMLVKTRRITLAHACARAHTEREREAYWKLMLTCLRLIGTIYGPFWASQLALVVKNLPANAGDIRDAGLIPGVGRSPGEGHGNPPQYSCLENPINRILVGSRTWLLL